MKTTSNISIYAHEKIMHSLWIHLVSGTIDQRAYSIVKEIVDRATIDDRDRRPYCQEIDRRQHVRHKVKR